MRSGHDPFRYAIYVVMYVIITLFDGIRVLGHSDAWVDPGSANVLLFPTLTLALAWIAQRGRLSHALWRGATARHIHDIGF